MVFGLVLGDGGLFNRLIEILKKVEEILEEKKTEWVNCTGITTYSYCGDVTEKDAINNL